MPRRRVRGKKETISYRDFEVLEFIFRYGVVNREAVRYWAQTESVSVFSIARSPSSGGSSGRG